MLSNNLFSQVSTTRFCFPFNKSILVVNHTLIHKPSLKMRKKGRMVLPKQFITANLSTRFANDKGNLKFGFRFPNLNRV